MFNKCILPLLLFLVVACSDDEPDFDIVEFSREIHFCSEGGIKAMKMEKDAWWINFAKVNDEEIYLTNNNFIDGKWFTVQGNAEQNEIIITMKPNETHQERAVRVGFQRYNVFDYFIVCQE